MKKIQKSDFIVLAVILGILAIATLGTVILLDINVEAAENNTSNNTTCDGNHNYGEWENSGVGVHVRYCTDCDASEAQNCDDYSSWVSYGADGHHWQCSVCGGFTMPRSHNYEDTFSTYKSASTGKIRHGRRCSDCGGYVTDEHDFVQGSVINGICAYSGCGLTCEVCGGDGPTSGTCSLCGMSSCDHDLTYMDYNDSQHWQVCNDCGETLTSRESHDFVGAACSECDYVCDHDGETGSSCSNCGSTLCSHYNLDYTYWQNEFHEVECRDCGNTVLEACTIESTWTQLSSYHIKACIYCDEVLEQGAHDSSGVGGTCSVCGYQMHSHSYTSNVVAPTCTTNGYTEYICSCRDSYTDSIVPALGHNMSAATCTEASTCQRTGCTHTEGAALGHDMSAATCTEASTCQRTGCTHTEGAALGHDMSAATCTEASTCQRTGCTYTEAALGHDMSAATCTEASTCQRTGCTYTEGAALGHNMSAATCTEASTCQRTGCTYTEGTALGHNVTTWSDNGNGTHSGTCARCTGSKTEDCTFGTDNICTKCGALKNTACEHTYQIDKIGATATQHWEKCTKCGNKRNIANHTFEHGVCTVCDYVCEHTNTISKKNETEHWEECTICGEEIPGTREEHTYEDGECDCGKQETQEECEHEDTTTKKNETEHWEECNDCEEEVPGTREEHTYEDGECECGKQETQEECEHENTTTKKNETEHWEECDDCGEEVPGTREKHTYGDGECECGKQEEDKECTHSEREWKADKDKHWQECKDCGEKITGTSGEHVYVDGKCKNCGLKDSTGSDSKLPNTGKTTLILTATALVVLAGVGAIKVKKYKDI